MIAVPLVVFLARIPMATLAAVGSGGPSWQRLPDSSPGVPWRFTLVPGLLRWAGPGRPVHLLVLAALAVGLLRLAAAAAWLLGECARVAMLAERATVMTLGGTAWLGWEPGQAPGHSASQLRDWPQSGGRDRR